MDSEFGEILHTRERTRRILLSCNKLDALTKYNLNASLQIMKTLVEPVPAQEDSMDYLWCEESSMQPFIYNLHNAKSLLELLDEFFKRKIQNKSIEAFTKIKTTKRPKFKLKVS